jgi:thiol-disulfide isomerase/thioredoxin
MNKTTIFAAASAVALLSTIPAFAQDKPQGGFVTLDLNWTEAGSPAESGLDGDAMKQMLERDEARVRGIQERAKAGRVTLDMPKAEETTSAPVAPPDSSRMRTISSDQMRQIVERDRARAKAMGERIRAAQVEAEAEKYLKEHPVEFTPGKTPAGWTDNFNAAVGKAKAEKKPILALFTGSDWCPPCQNLEKNILLQPAFQEFAKKHLVTLFLDFPRDAKLDDAVKKQNDSLAKKFSVEAYPTILVLSADGQKELWKQVGYTALFLEKLQEGVAGLDKDFPETAKAVKDEMEADAKAKAEAKAAREKAELEEFEKQQKEQAEAARRNAELHPFGAGRIVRRGSNPLDQLSDEEREALFRELDKNGPVKGPDVLPNGGPAPLRPSVKLD